MKIIKNTVIIPTAGIGSRMGNYTKNLNKALLPYKNKPIISHIIDSFPIDTKFIVPIGYLSNQIKDFCQIAYKDRDIEFVPIDDYLSPKSGTSYTLRQCRNKVNGPFWYVACDTYFNELVINRVIDSNCYFVKTVPEKDTCAYTMFDIDNYSKITKITFKKPTFETSVAFTGLVYIHHYNDFFDSLEELNSTELVYSIKLGDTIDTLNTWLDFGDPITYQTELGKSQKFDFAKKNEITYICNNRVVKWWLDESTPRKKLEKTRPLCVGQQLVNTVFPKNCEVRGNWLAYDFFPGNTMYVHNNYNTFPKLLDWLNSKLWVSTPDDIRIEAKAFYKDKSLARIQQFKKKYPNLPKVSKVNGTEVDDSIIDNIDWDYLANTLKPGLIHGDLQFDNIIVNEKLEFMLIDWRPDFAGKTQVGDIYYDLAKLYGGFIIDYSKIKDGQFDIMHVDDTEVLLQVPSIPNKEVYQNELRSYAAIRSFDMKKIDLLVPIIFLNMAPLHAAPFDQLLWYLGLKLLHETLL